MTEPREIFFDAIEYQQRIDKVREEMVKAGVDLLIMTNPTHVCYLVGHFTQAVHDLMFLALPMEGTPFLQLPQFEHPRNHVSGVGAEVVSSWNLGTNPADAVVREIERRGLRSGSTAVEVSGSYTPFTVIAQLLDGLDAKPLQNLVDEIRLVKSSSELTYLREAARITDAGAQAALDSFREGAVDHDVAASSLAALVSSGSEALTVDPYICFGWRTAAPHTNRGGDVAQAEDPLFIELGASRARYTAPLMRSAVATRTTTALTELADVSDEIISAVCDTTKAGVPVAEVAAAGRKVIEPILSRVLWHHTYGYSVGLSFAPSWADCSHFLINEKNKGVLETGMVFHLPTQIRVDRQYGAGFSETIIVTDNGCEQLSQLPRQLVVR